MLENLVGLVTSTATQSSTATPNKTEKTAAKPPTKVASGSYSTSDCKLLTADDIASVLGVAAGDVSEQPVQKQEGQCMESWVFKKGGMPAGSIVVTLIETAKNPAYSGATPKLCLANTKKMVAGDQPSLGIGDYDSFVMMGGTIMFGKGKYMVQVSCPMGCATEQITALAKLVAKHM
jgi:hypothetical protein